MKKYYLSIALSFLFLVFFASNAFAYSLYTNFESSAAQNTFSEFQESITNSPPQFLDSNLPYAAQGQPYEGYIEVYDADGDDLRWEIELIGNWSSWDSWFECTSKLALENINTPGSFTNKLRACNAGDVGDYSFKVIIDDGKENGRAEEEYPIRVNASPDVYFCTPETTTEDCSQVADVNYSQEDYNFIYIASSTKPLEFNVLSASTADTCPHNLFIGDFPMGWQKKLVGDCQKFRVSASFNPKGNSYFKYPQTMVHDLDLTSVNDFGVKSLERNLKITVVNNAPEISRQNCSGGKVDDLFVCGIDAIDPEDNNFALIIEDLPDGLRVKRGSELSDLSTDIPLLGCIPGFHEEGGVCVSNIKGCSFANGPGKRIWHNGVWGECVFINQGESCVSSNNCMNAVYDDRGVCQDTSPKIFGTPCGTTACSSDTVCKNYPDEATNLCNGNGFCNPGVCNWSANVGQSCGEQNCDSYDTGCRNYINKNKLCTELGNCEEVACNNWKPQNNCPSGQECDVPGGSCIDICEIFNNPQNNGSPISIQYDKSKAPECFCSNRGFSRWEVIDTSYVGDGSNLRLVRPSNSCSGWENNNKGAITTLLKCCE